MTGLLFASLRRREVREVELFAVLDTLNGTFPEAFRQTQIGNKHDMDDTGLENQWVAMEDVR